MFHLRLQASFFNQRLFGTDFSPLLDAAREEVFCECLSHELKQTGNPLTSLPLSSYVLHTSTENAQPRSVSLPAQPVVGPINPATLFGEAECPRNFDFYTLTQKELEKFEVEVEWDVSKVGLIHGVSLSRKATDMVE
jgi:hypothetical protein